MWNVRLSYDEINKRRSLTKSKPVTVEKFNWGYTETIRGKWRKKQTKLKKTNLTGMTVWDVL